eukprot:m.129930 g.129930  ORF g.129930 m.129930 type:complete len:300 (+) comp38002_c0_seq2:110-1009(+)
MAGKLVTVFGATGAQGGPVASALLQRGFKVRAITRNPDGDKAKALKSAGMEVAKASLDDVASLGPAISGSYGVFILTNFWEFLDVKREVDQGKNAVDACKAAGVKHVVFSGLEPTEKLSGIRVPHFEGKAVIGEYLLKESGLPYKTIVRYPGYWDNFLTATKAQKQEDGSFDIPYPVGEHPLHGIAVADGGPCVASIFESPEKFSGKIVGLSSSCEKMSDYAAVLSKHLGKQFKPTSMTWQEFAKLPLPAADDLGAMFAFYQTEHFHRDIALTKELNPQVQSFEEFVVANLDKFKEAYP